MRVWVTRDETPDGPFSTALRKAGLTAVWEPVMERRVCHGGADVIEQLGTDDWLVLTSVFAIESAALASSRKPCVAVVGENSRLAAESRGFRVELVSAGGDGESLFRELREKVNRGRVCYPRSSLADPPDPWPGVELTSPVLYETLPRAFDRNVVNGVDIVSVVSPSAVDIVGPVTLPFASIGPITSEALRRIGIEPAVEAPHRTFESLAQAVVDYDNDSRRRQRSDDPRSVV